MKFVKIDGKYINIDKIVSVFKKKHYSSEQRAEMMAGNFNQLSTHKTVIQLDNINEQVFTDMLIEDVVTAILLAEQE